MQHSVFKYNCEKFSIKDILSFLDKSGYKYELVDNRSSGGDVDYMILGMDIYISLPDQGRFRELKILKAFGPPGIGWQPINVLYSQRNRARESGDAQKIKEAEVAYNQWHKEAQKLYNELKRKFGIKGIKTLADVEEAIKKGEYPMSIKDQDYIESLRNASDKKPWQFWK
jgi:hypothetical protein